jgi:DNA-directed RNA polymerase subunit omega
MGSRMTIDKPVGAFHNKYSLVKGAARRARQLQSGALPLIDAKSTKACRVAQDEIKQGHVKFVLPEQAVEPPLHIFN